MIAEILAYAVKHNCSDINIRALAMPMMRVNGDLLPIPHARVLGAQQIQEMIESLMNEAQKKIYRSQLELDFTIEIAQGTRFRISAYYVIQGCAASFRPITDKIPTLETLNAPASFYDLVHAKKGLILVTGPTGSGKSTSLAAMIDYMNTNFCYNIVTIEDPIEFLHPNKKSLISQREIGHSTLSFSNALRSALRENPDVILVGEMRDLETIQLALTAAETGHLVLATLHTNSAVQSIDRIIDVFSAQDKASVRSMLSGSLRAVISQRLLKSIDNKRCAAFEVMLSNSSIRNLIREDKVPQLQSLMEINKKQGMLLMKDSINELLNKGYISQETADEALRANQ